MLRRTDLEQREKQALAPYAVKNAESRGREHPEAEDPFRTAFQRDRDRVIHSKAFRRLKGKTQVFVAHYGDHYRSRLAHSMEVAQLSRDIARTLNLNEDLAETIGLAHDLGHTPFGHSGQDEMHELMQAYGERFEHNEQSRRVVEILEEKSPKYPGLNLSFEVRDGMIKHRTTYDAPLAPDHFMPSLEGQLVNLADEIAYQNHDIDDGLRAGIFKIEALDGLKIWQEAKKTVDQALPLGFRIGAMISSLIGLMIGDLVAETETRVKRAGVTSVTQVCALHEPVCDFSPAMAQKTRELKTWLYKNFYLSPGVAEYNQKGKQVIRTLFEHFMKHPEAMTEKPQARLAHDPLHLVVKDYISGMTDNFALELYENFLK